MIFILPIICCTIINLGLQDSISYPVFTDISRAESFQELISRCNSRKPIPKALINEYVGFETMINDQDSTAFLGLNAGQVYDKWYIEFIQNIGIGNQGWNESTVFIVTFTKDYQQIDLAKFVNFCNTCGDTITIERIVHHQDFPKRFVVNKYKVPILKEKRYQKILLESKFKISSANWMINSEGVLQRQ